jgi:hypothetical protein
MTSAQHYFTTQKPGALPQPHDDWFCQGPPRKAKDTLHLAFFPPDSIFEGQKLEALPDLQWYWPSIEHLWVNLAFWFMDTPNWLVLLSFLPKGALPFCLAFVPGCHGYVQHSFGGQKLEALANLYYYWLSIEHLRAAKRRRWTVWSYRGDMAAASAYEITAFYKLPKACSPVHNARWLVGDHEKLEQTHIKDQCTLVANNFLALRGWAQEWGDSELQQF